VQNRAGSACWFGLVLSGCIAELPLIPDASTNSPRRVQVSPMSKKQVYHPSRPIEEMQNNLSLRQTESTRKDYKQDLEVASDRNCSKAQRHIKAVGQRVGSCSKKVPIAAGKGGSIKALPRTPETLADSEHVALLSQTECPKRPSCTFQRYCSAPCHRPTKSPNVRQVVVQPGQALRKVMEVLHTAGTRFVPAPGSWLRQVTRQQWNSIYSSSGLPTFVRARQEKAAFQKDGAEDPLKQWKLSSHRERLSVEKLWRVHRSSPMRAASPPDTLVAP